MSALSLSEIWEKGHPIGQRGTALLTEIDALIDEAKLDEALQKTNEAIFKYPAEINFHLKLSQIHEIKYDFKSAIKANIRALRMMPGYSLFGFNIAWMLLKEKKYRMGLKVCVDLVERTSQNFLNVRNSPTFWHGENLNGKTLLIMADSGIGDHLNFFPVIDRILKLYNCTIHYQCLPPLKSTLECSYKHDRLIYHEHTDSIKPTDYYSSMICTYFTWILSQHINWDDICWDVPYIKPPQLSREFWSSKIQSSAKLKIGLCWAGAGDNTNDQNRSMSIAQLANTLKPLQDKAVFYALGIKKDPKWEEGIDKLPITFIDYRDQVKSISDSAAMMQQMDIIIAVCTGEAHLAAALGKKTFLLLPYNHCWRWPMDGETTPFYPTVTLIRQNAFKDWSEALSILKSILLEKMNG